MTSLYCLIRITWSIFIILLLVSELWVSGDHVLAEGVASVVPHSPPPWLKGGRYQVGRIAAARPGWNGVPEGRNGVSQGRNGVSQGRNGVTQGWNGVTQGWNGVMQGWDGGTQPGGSYQVRQGWNRANKRWWLSGRNTLAKPYPGPGPWQNSNNNNNPLHTTIINNNNNNNNNNPSHTSKSLFSFTSDVHAPHIKHPRQQYLFPSLSTFTNEHQTQLQHRPRPSPRRPHPHTHTPPHPHTPLHPPLVGPLGSVMRRGGVMAGDVPQEVMDALPRAISMVMQDYSNQHQTTTTTTTTTTTEPPVIWFPNQHEDCENTDGGGGGGGFSTFSLLALLISGVNLVGLLANNANNNLNNNNNDNNINNNVIQAGNENNGNNNANVFTAITTAAGKKKRKKRRRSVMQADEKRGGDVGEEKRGGDVGEEKILFDEEMCWLEDEDEEDIILTGEEVASVVSLVFLRAYLQAALTEGGDSVCLGRSLCVANVDASDWGDLAAVLATALSESHVEWVSRLWPEMNRLEVEAGGEAGRRTGATYKSCHQSFPCPPSLWTNLTHQHTVTETLIHLIDTQRDW
ncbi:hypothetical protein Pmani_017929 [Petrolisthes manimaculis]|uniref:Uncharacterized protein n=1 Tax=Petrolisthes manimaculis TaxID=1843537 RepID=A0AAE1PL67_9EUCA|nr:hypothetical protein Pmani_017929 [Petrolisthes manimaculis]